MARAAAELAASAADSNVGLIEVDTNDIHGALQATDDIYKDLYFGSGANVVNSPATLASNITIMGPISFQTDVSGALRTGGTKVGTAMLVGAAGIGLAALALVPVLGYLEAVAVPAVGARLRRRAPRRYAGLRPLAD